ncbi:hypothetical protein MCP_0952 [Methanocella paludicola SANAE]|uniref:Glycosyltransferase 2-like domain-containing protein n=1 Tax=Methanocella paludicola (strain DSM 17711 / JCM 13418 / NBRC 101707 / SANAE) TaxID=304371 RepID=D1YX52_METPS|nr:histidine phosphatase family protein [Methanocella paludicola]BAI61024.1 hypothetical protein MCP_0952 [Methanocella paludicola SANAE]
MSDSTIGPSEKVRFDTTLSLIKQQYPDSYFRLLGSGHESVILTDNRFTYKIFDNPDFKYKSLLQDFKIRFANSKRFLCILDILDIDGIPILKYEYEDSTEYTGGHEEEIIDFLVECKKYGVVCWDVKPRNFRIFKNGLRFIDYGWDIKPYNFKDFVFMVQRTYLSLRYPTATNFKELAHEALTNWELHELDGFPNFFNKVYERVLNTQIVCEYPIKYDHKKEYRSMIGDLLNKFAMGNERTIEHISPGTEPLDIVPNSINMTGPLDNLSNYAPVNVFISNCVIDLKKDQLVDYITSVKKCLVPNGLFILILPDQFYSYSIEELQLHDIRTLITKAGFSILSEDESPYYTEIYGNFKTDTLILTNRLAQTGNERISLIIKACYQDGANLERQVQHIVSQCKQPRSFLETIIVIDPKKDHFLRQFDEPSIDKTYRVLENLKMRSVIDNYYTAPDNTEQIRKINQRWFNLECSNSHSIQNIPITPQIYAFELARGDYILQADCDVMIGRRDREHDFIGDMISALKNNPDAISVSFNIAHDPDSKVNDYTSPGNGEYKPEVRFCLFDKDRLFKLRPFPNELIDGRLRLSWYQSIYEFQKRNGFVSLRGGDPRSFYVHPPNEYKRYEFTWLSIRERIGSGNIPDIQFENFDLVGIYEDWCLPKREEPYIFIICGRNITPAKFYRCWQSLKNQSRPYWGAIIIDDASTNGLPDYIGLLVKPYASKVTFIKNPSRKGVLQNIYDAIKNYCSNPYSVIIILDADDMLIGNSALNTIHRHYIAGADMTSGSTIRMDKGYYDYKPDFAHPRNHRGGDVWMHIRTFRKYLFDRIAQDDFINNGKWVDKFTELTYMVPIAEMASNPHHIKVPLYLWEPTQARNKLHYKMNRETNDFITSRKPYNKVIKPSITAISPPGEIINSLQPGQLIFIRHAERVRSDGRKDIISDDVPLTNDGAIDCKTFGKHLPIKLDLIITSPALRAVQTAENIRAGNGSDCKIIPLESLRRLKIFNYKEWRRLKNKKGWHGTIQEWVAGKISDKVIYPYDSTIIEIIKSLNIEMDKHHSQNILVVSHNHVIDLLYYYYFNYLAKNVFHLNGFVIDRNEILSGHDKLEVDQ